MISDAARSIVATLLGAANVSPTFSEELMPWILHRLQNDVSTTGGESRERGWTAVNQTERRNHLCLKRLEPEVARHHVRNRPCSEVESLPPSHEIPHI